MNESFIMKVQNWVNGETCVFDSVFVFAFVMCTYLFLYEKPMWEPIQC